jgi:hypothetical protein
MEALKALMEHHRENLLPKLTKLELEAAFDTSDGFEQFFEAVGKTCAFGSVKELSLKGVSQEQCLGLAQGFSAAVSEGAFPQLKKLEFERVKMGDAELLKKLCEGLKGSRCAESLEHIRCRWCNIPTDGFYALCDLIRGGSLPMLSFLDMHEREIGDKGFERLMESLAVPSFSFSKLTKLSLFLNLTNKSMDVLASALERDSHLRNLTHLDISSNQKITDVGAQRLCEAIRAGHLANLIELNVTETYIEKEGAQTLARAVRDHCPRLRTLDLPFAVEEKVEKKVAEILQERKEICVLYSA